MAAWHGKELPARTELPKRSKQLGVGLFEYQWQHVTGLAHG